MDGQKPRFGVLKINVKASFFPESEDLSQAENNIEADKGGFRVAVPFVRDSEIPPRTEMNRDENRRGAATVTEANGGGTSAVISLARALRPTHV